MSHFFSAACILQLISGLALPLFIALCVFINNILSFAYNSHRAKQVLEKEKEQWQAQCTGYRNNNADDAATIGRRLDRFEENIKDEEKCVAANICMNTKWLNRIIFRRPAWFVNHVMLNQMIEKNYLKRENEAWQKFIHNPQRLINMVYTCTNGYLSYNAMQAYRIAVC